MSGSFRLGLSHHMKKNKVLAVSMKSLLCLICLGSASAAFSQVRGPSTSNAIQRTVLSEEQSQGTLLLVMERLGTHVPKVVFRKLFSLEKKSEFVSLKNYYLDLPTTVSDANSFEATFNHNPLWNVTHFWTLADENDYSSWVSKEVTAGLLSGTGIAVDCADLAIVLRWVYSRNHGLPVANSLADTGELFGQWFSTAAWDLLPRDPDWKKDERFKAALHFALEGTYTHSLLNDLYPIQISQEWVTPGTTYLHLRGVSGHTQVLYRVAKGVGECQTLDNCLFSIYGNEPSSQGFYFAALHIFDDNTERTGAFMRVRWPRRDAEGHWTLVPKKEMPGYSTEQYDWDGAFEDALMSHLGYVNLTDVQKVVFEGKIVYGLVSERIPLTQMGYYLCSMIKCDPASSLYDAYSTPSHDERLRAHQKKFMSKLASVSPDDPEIVKFRKSMHRPFMQRTDVWFDDYIYNVNGILDGLTSDPTKSLFERWGLSEENLESRVATLAWAWLKVWSERASSVYYGSEHCGANWEKDGTRCPAGSDDYALYATKRIDEALRRGSSAVGPLFPLASPELQQLFLLWLSDSPPFNDTPKVCSWNSNFWCTAKDFFFNSHGVLDRMTFAPNDSLRKRYGLPN